MNAQLRTATVVALCRHMLNTRDFSACPILADALQDAACEAAELLSRLRGELPRVEAERLVNLIYSEETAEAVRRLDEFVDELGVGGYPGDLPTMTYETLMTAARKFAEDQRSYPLGAGSMNWSNATADPGVEEQFWKNYEIVTGTTLGFEIPARGTDFFTCHC